MGIFLRYYHVFHSFLWFFLREKPAGLCFENCEVNKVNYILKPYICYKWVTYNLKIPREYLVSLAVYTRAFYLCLCLGVFLFLYLSPQQFLLIGFAISMKDFKNKG